MVILSQNKKSLFNLDNIKSIDVLDNEIYISDDFVTFDVCIAKYETEERAKEVLREIAGQYMISQACLCPSVNVKPGKLDEIRSRVRNAGKIKIYM